MLLRVHSHCKNHESTTDLCGLDGARWVCTYSMWRSFLHEGLFFVCFRQCNQHIYVLQPIMAVQTDDPHLSSDLDKGAHFIFPLICCYFESFPAKTVIALLIRPLFFQYLVEDNLLHSFWLCFHSERSLLTSHWCAPSDFSFGYPSTVKWPCWVPAEPWRATIDPEHLCVFTGAGLSGQEHVHEPPSGPRFSPIQKSLNSYKLICKWGHRNKNDYAHLNTGTQMQWLL